MQDLKTAAQQTADFLKTLTTVGGLKLRFRITAVPARLTRMDWKNG